MIRRRRVGSIAGVVLLRDRLQLRLRDCRFLARRVAPLASRKEQAQALNDMYPELASGVFAVLDSDMRKLHRAAVRYMEPKGPEASRLIA